MKSADPPSIEPASRGHARDVLSLVLSDLQPDEREERVEALLAEARQGRLSLAGLLGARRGGELVGAIFSQVQVGSTAVVWPPRLAPGEPPSTAERLLAATNRWLESASVCAAHAMLPSAAAADDAVLRGAGYEPLAELFYLVCGEEVFPYTEPPGPLAFEPYCRANHQRLARVVEATYQQTLDCPAMDGQRQIEDVLAGYRATGEFSPEQWLIARHAGRDVGCLLLADHPEQDQCELVYMGLVVAARGNGWGIQIAGHAQWLTRELGRTRLVLAVDAANGPALRAYTAAGFEAWEHRHVYGKRLALPE